jgi:hypothetical protein
MKHENDPLDRMFRAAAAHRRSATAPDDSTVPWTLEQRVLANLRRMSPEAEPGWLLPVIRGAFASASLVVVACATLYFAHPVGQTVASNETAPTSALEYADIPVTQMFASAQ